MRKRIITAQAKPEQPIGSTVRLPDIRQHIREAHEWGGWGPYNTHETQASDSFRFSGRTFTNYLRSVFGSGIPIRSVYFPAAYTARVALALKEAGYDVFASDISGYWSGHARDMGLRAERRGFEDLPKERFDAVASFEPFCVPSAIRYVGMLRIMSASMPYIEICLAKPGKAPMPRWKRMERIKHPDAWQEELYNAKCMAHAIRENNGVFTFHSTLPTVAAEARASLDLRIIERDMGHGHRISLSGLASELGSNAGMVNDSLRRIDGMFSRLLCLDQGHANSRTFTVTQ